MTDEKSLLALATSFKIARKVRRCSDRYVELIKPKSKVDIMFLNNIIITFLFYNIDLITWTFMVLTMGQSLFEKKLKCESWNVNDKTMFSIFNLKKKTFLLISLWLKSCDVCALNLDQNLIYVQKINLLTGQLHVCS